jgi:hypothetical protein
MKLEIKMEKQLSDTKRVEWDGLTLVFTDSRSIYRHGGDTAEDAVQLTFSPDEQINLAEFMEEMSERMRAIMVNRLDSLFKG